MRYEIATRVLIPAIVTRVLHADGSAIEMQAYEVRLLADGQRVTTNVQNFQPAPPEAPEPEPEPELVPQETLLCEPSEAPEPKATPAPKPTKAEEKAAAKAAEKAAKSREKGR